MSEEECTLRDVVRIFLYLMLFSFLDILFLYMGLVTITDIHCSSIPYIVMYVFLFTYLSMYCYFSFFIHMFLILCMQSIISILH